jgi:hypothetical protein
MNDDRLGVHGDDCRGRGGGQSAAESLGSASLLRIRSLHFEFSCLPDALADGPRNVSGPVEQFLAGRFNQDFTKTGVLRLAPKFFNGWFVRSHDRHPLPSANYANGMPDSAWIAVN